MVSPPSTGRSCRSGGRRFPGRPGSAAPWPAPGSPRGPGGRPVPDAAPGRCLEVPGRLRRAARWSWSVLLGLGLVVSVELREVVRPPSPPDDLLAAVLAVLEGGHHFSLSTGQDDWLC